MPPYTLILFTPSTPTPTYLHHLATSHPTIPFFSSSAFFFRHTDPSTWPWQHIALLPGTPILLPAACKAAQIVRWEMHAGEVFSEKSVPETIARDEIEAEDRKTQMCGDEPDDWRFFSLERKWSAATGPLSVLVFSTFDNDDAAQMYTQHLQRGGVHMRLHARIVKHEQKLGAHAKNYIPRRQGQSKLKRKAVSSAEPETKPSTHLALLSFSSPAAFGVYLSCAERQAWEESMTGEGRDVQERFILTFEKELEGVVGSGDWGWGNVHEPFGQDWFG